MTGGTAAWPAARVRAAALVLLGLLLAAVLWSRAIGQRESYHMMDEAIAVAVTDRVLAERTLDTNWARTQVMPEFRYDHYNFSSYYLAAAAWLQLTGEARPADRLPPLRWLGTEERVTGWIAISEMYFRDHWRLTYSDACDRGAATRWTKPEGYAWLRDYEPLAFAGRSIRIYHVARNP